MSKTFWKTFKPFFSDNSEVNEKIILVEKEAVLSDDLKIAETMNNYFVNITKSMNIKEWPDPIPNLQCDDIVQKAIHEYSHHPSIIAIKSRFGDSNKKFKFQHILPIEVQNTINELDASKSTCGDITSKLIKETIYSCENKITDCLNNSILDGKFPTSMKYGDITPIFKANEKIYKENYRPICKLSPFSKVFEKILAKQIGSFMNEKLSDKLCGFRKGFSTQHALIHLLENWRHHIENKEIVGAVFCDLSKAFDTIPHDLLIAKLEAYGFSNESLRLIYGYLRNRKQRC